MAATVTLQPSADSYVQDGSPTKNYGTQTSLRVRGGGSPTYKSYVTFDLSGVSGPVTSAKLRLFTTDASPYGGQVYPVPAASWTESGITFNNAPALANPIGLLGRDDGEHLGRAERHLRGPGRRQGELRVGQHVDEQRLLLGQGGHQPAPARRHDGLNGDGAGRSGWPAGAAGGSGDAITAAWAGRAGSSRAPRALTLSVVRR